MHFIVSFVYIGLFSSCIKSWLLCSPTGNWLPSQTHTLSNLLAFLNKPKKAFAPLQFTSLNAFTSLRECEYPWLVLPLLLKISTAEDERTQVQGPFASKGDGVTSSSNKDTRQWFYREKDFSNSWNVRCFYTS